MLILIMQSECRGRTRFSSKIYQFEISITPYLINKGSNDTQLTSLITDQSMSVTQEVSTTDLPI